jgi:methylthioribose-1-phosphate isomerase
VIVLDQTKLPWRTSWLPLRTLDDAVAAIRDMRVRGAPLIGATAAYGVALALAEGIALDRACTALAAARPTAINLRWALDRMRAELAAGRDAFAAAAGICDDDVACNRAIGDHGLALLRQRAQPIRVLTHCNAGWLATVDGGTALAPIYAAHDAGLRVHVWVSETRPRGQGALTAWELAQHGVPHAFVADNACGHLIARGDVDVVIVGTDRTTARGDVANKIGTYLKALAARAHGVPFYVALPGSSIDWTLDDGAAIPIEERDGNEVSACAGAPVVPATTPVANPGFDVTPAALVTAFVTERGVCTPAQLKELFQR